MWLSYNGLLHYIHQTDQSIQIICDFSGSTQNRFFNRRNGVGEGTQCGENKQHEAFSNTTKSLISDVRVSEDIRIKG